MGGVASPILGVTSTVYKQAFLHIHGKERKRRRGELINFLHYLLQCLSFSSFSFFFLFRRAVGGVLQAVH